MEIPNGATHFYESNMTRATCYLKLVDEKWYIFINDSFCELATELYDNVNKNAELIPMPEVVQLDNINSPTHYTQGKVECIDAIESATVGKNGFEAYCVGSVIKYLWRYEQKGGKESIEKAKWYLNKLLEQMK